ncbi:MAG: LysM peptidoglycan-binding domain-containing protein [Clostridia bacterium]|nr:MAG: LysM peptidoglycan-binding domain-containing protein [Clostridia bacterium]
MDGQQYPFEIPACPGGTLYTIRPGDSYFSLARRFSTTVEALEAANPGVDPTNLRIGMIICIPVPPVPGPCPGGFLYTVEAGDTFFSLARRFGIAVEALIAANPGVDPDKLFVGQQVCIPAPSPSPPCPGDTYTIQAGDTFSSLARRFGTTIEALRAANPGVDPDRLQVGQVICLPPGIPGPIPCPGGTIYLVRPGDTLASLGRRFGVPLPRLIEANPHLVNPNQLQVGEPICIPRQL